MKHNTQFFVEYFALDLLMNSDGMLVCHSLHLYLVHLILLPLNIHSSSGDKIAIIVINFLRDKSYYYETNWL